MNTLFVFESWKSLNMRFIYSLVFNASVKFVFRNYCSRPQFLPVVRVVSLSEDDAMKVSFRINNSPNLTIKIPNNQNVSAALTRIKLMAALQRKKEEIRREVVKKYSNSVQVEVEVEDECANVCLIGNNEVINDTTKNIDAWSQANILKIGDVEYEVQFNIPTVTNMTLPDFIVPGCYIRPHIIIECASIEDCVFKWYRSAVNNIDSDWIPVGEGFHYLTKPADSNGYLKLVCSPQRDKLIGSDFIAITKNVVEDGPTNFPFEERQKWTEPIYENNLIRCVSYNTLANMYVEKRKFPYATHKALNVYYRKQLLLRELLGYNSDVLCLQEIQERVFDYDLLPVLKKAGFSGFYTRKGGRRFEGLATFFQTSKFRPIFKQGVLLNEMIKDKNIFIDLLMKVSGNYKDMGKLLAQDTVLQVCLLETIENEKFKILIANTHLYSNKDNPEVRLLQAALCINYLEHLIKSKALDSIGVLFCGDFNSLPGSEAFNFLTTGAFQICSSWKNSNLDLKANEDNMLRHSLSLESACGIPEYTNFTEEFHGCLDYIFYSKDSLDVTHVVPFPSHESVTEQVGLPNEFYPSDHIALVCTLQHKS